MRSHRTLPGRFARPRRAAFAAPFLLASIAVAACSGDDGGIVTPPVPVASVEVHAPTIVIMAGDSVALQATARSATGQPLQGRPLTWESSDADVAQVDAGGRVKALAAGTVEIRAASEGRTGKVTLTVVEPEPVAPSLSALMPAQVYAGSEGLAILVVGDGFTPGSIVLWDGSARPTHRSGTREMQVFVEAEDLDVPGAVDIEVVNPDGGRSQALTFTIIAPPGPVQKWLVIEPDPLVLLAGMTRQMTARYIDAQGNPQPGTPQVTYWSDDPGVAAVTAAGMVTAVRAGTARIHAAGQGYHTSSVVEIRPLPVGPKVLYQTRPADQSGQVVDTVQWQLGDSTVEATLQVRIARIELDMETNRYVQEFQAFVRHGGALVGTTGWMERGSWAYGWIEQSLVFTPDGGGDEFTAFGAGLGELRVHQRVRRAANPDSFTYVIREIPTP